MARPRLTDSMRRAMALMREKGALVRVASGMWVQADHYKAPPGDFRETFSAQTVSSCVRRGAAKFTQYRRSPEGEFAVRVEAIEEGKA